MRARTRDRRVYLGSHPVLFALLALTRHRPALRLGGTVLVHDREAFVAALTRVPLDRTAEGTTGGAAGRLTGADMLFDQSGAAHRRTRRSAAEALGTAGVARLRPVWLELLDRRLAPLRDGGQVDLVELATEMSGVTAAALLDLPLDGRALAEAALSAGATAARAHLPGLFRRRAHRAASAAAARLTILVTQAGPRCMTADHVAGAGRGRKLDASDERCPRTGTAADAGDRTQSGLATMLAVAAINTSVAGLPRAAAWCADDDLWDWAATHPQALADELLRVTSPTPLLPRVAAAAASLPAATGCPASAAAPAGRAPHGGDALPGREAAGHQPGYPGSAGGFAVRPGDRLLLIARHAVAAHRDGPSPADPAPAHIAQLVFGTGPHACPGARLARTQLADLLVALAPCRPVVVRARADRRAALPGWASLVVRATRSGAEAGASPARSSRGPGTTPGSQTGQAGATAARTQDGPLDADGDSSPGPARLAER